MLISGEKLFRFSESFLGVGKSGKKGKGKTVPVPSPSTWDDIFLSRSYDDGLAQRF